MSASTTGRRNARRATAERILEAHPASLASTGRGDPAEALAEADGVQMNNCLRDGVLLMPVTLYGPSMLPVRSRGSPDGLCASRLSRRTGCQTFCSCTGCAMNVKPV